MAKEFQTNFFENLGKELKNVDNSESMMLLVFDADKKPKLYPMSELISKINNFESELVTLRREVKKLKQPALEFSKDFESQKDLSESLVEPKNSKQAFSEKKDDFEDLSDNYNKMNKKLTKLEKKVNENAEDYESIGSKVEKKIKKYVEKGIIIDNEQLKKGLIEFRKELTSGEIPKDLASSKGFSSSDKELMGVFTEINQIKNGNLEVKNLVSNLSTKISENEHLFNSWLNADYSKFQGDTTDKLKFLDDRLGILSLMGGMTKRDKHGNDLNDDPDEKDDQLQEEEPVICEKGSLFIDSEFLGVEVLDYLIEVLFEGKIKTSSKIMNSKTHGGLARDFHRRCDKFTNTLVIAKSGEFIAGGFTDVLWDGSGMKESKNTFLFSFNKKKKYQVINSKNAICCEPEYGACFGGKLISMLVNKSVK